MPKFNLAPLPSNLEPVVPTPDQRKAEVRARNNQRLEDAAGSVPVVGGVLRGGAQLFNALGSPDSTAGVFTGPINAVSKLGNAIGDWAQRKPIDTSDAWTISDQTTRQLNPNRWLTGQGTTPADEAGLEIGEGIGAELAGFATGATIINRVKNIARLKAIADAAKKTQLARSFAVTARTNQGVRAGLNVGKNVGEALVGTTLAAPFIDQEDGNLANLGDAVGLRLPGRLEEDDNYLQGLVKGIAVEGIAAPMAVLGLGALVPPIRRGMASGDLGWMDELAEAELAPYVPGEMPPALPPAAAADLVPDGSRALPARSSADLSFLEAPPGMFDSAIGRSIQEQTQIRQVTQQRQRLQDMGLVEQGAAGQLEFTFDGVVDPEIRTQIRQLQTQRGQTIKQSIETGEDATEALGKIDQEINDLILAGRGADAMPPEAYVQPDLDLPDGRPEMDTFLAQLDELGDRELRDVHSRVRSEIAEERNAMELTGAQQRVTEINEQIVRIQERAEAGEITPVGAKRLLTKAQKQLDEAQQTLTRIQARSQQPQALVGQQLELTLNQQLALDLADEVQLPPIREIAAPNVSKYGYRSEADYRDALGGWTRDQLRRLAMPQSSPEVAAIVKARTGRRVWQAKKQDIIDALAEWARRDNRWLPPTPEQLALELRQNQFGDAAPLFDQPADLSVPNMGTIVDADGNEISVPMGEYQPRGIDPETRERLKKEILQQALNNGEVQPPVTPIPVRPSTTFQQGSLIDDLMADETGQLAMMFNTDQLPTYKASGKNTDALLEEIRLRYEYNELDAGMQQAQRDAYRAQMGWDELSWEEKKRLGILGQGFYSLQDVAPDVVRPATPQFTPELEVKGARAPKPYNKVWTADGVKPEAEVKAQQQAMAKAAPKATDSAIGPVTPEMKRAAKKSVNDIKGQRAALAKKREQLLKQQQGARC